MLAALPACGGASANEPDEPQRPERACLPPHQGTQIFDAERLAGHPTDTCGDFEVVTIHTEGAALFRRYGDRRELLVVQMWTTWVWPMGQHDERGLPMSILDCMGLEFERRCDDTMRFIAVNPISESCQARVDVARIADGRMRFVHVSLTGLHQPLPGCP